MKAKHVLAITICVILGFAFSAFFIYCIEDYSWYNNAYKEALDVATGKQTSDVRMMEGHEKIPDANNFDRSVYLNEAYNYNDGDDWYIAGKALYDATGIQLYKRIFANDKELGKTLLSTADLTDYCMDAIEQLPAKDTAIVVYEFSGDEVDGSYLYLSESVYYGDAVMKHLSTQDLTMIKYILTHGYDLFRDYDTVILSTWELIATNIRDGYDANLYSSDRHHYSEWDVQYYKDERNGAIIGASVNAIIALLIWATLIKMCHHWFVAVPRKLKAEEEMYKAKADAAILEADIKKLPDEADELVDKYLNED